MFQSKSNLLVLLILSILTLNLLSCNEEYKPVDKIKQVMENKILPDQTAADFNVEFVDSNYTKAILHGKRAYIYQERMETLIDSGLWVEFMSKTSGYRISLLTADSAKIDDRTKNMLARGNVVVVNDSDGTKLETSLLEWDNTTQKLYSTEFVKISSPFEKLQGWGFESDQNLKNYKILKVSGVQK